MTTRSDSTRLDEPCLNPRVTMSMQLRVLRRLFRLVAQAADSGRRPVVEIDLDLTSLMPIQRTMGALRSVGESFAIDCLKTPESLPILPGYSDEAWNSFVSLMSITLGKSEAARFALGSDPFAVFHEKYWDTDLLQFDRPTAGLASFVERIRELGGTVVFISGRWLPEHIPHSLSCLRRAGVLNPKLVIGNDFHPTIVPKERSLSDSEIKVRHQNEVTTSGTPVVIIDDRVANRKAIARSQRGNGIEMMEIGICIPGFTYDSDSDRETNVISTFETFDNTLEDSIVRPYVLERYGNLGSIRPWFGMYEGVGHNQLAYSLPRQRLTSSLESKAAVYSELLSSLRGSDVTEEELLRLCEKTIPIDQLERISESFQIAEEFARMGVAASFPSDEKERERIWLCLIASWLHSRDIESVMRALGYELRATGVHDIEEYVIGREIRCGLAANLAHGAKYSDWVLKWIGTIEDERNVNVGSLNPALSVGMALWRPTDVLQDAMDIHRLSSHHEGDGGERYDPVEAAVNNILHQREGIYGIRKEPIESWNRLWATASQDQLAEALSKSSVGRDIVKDAVKAAMELEQHGFITPWELCCGPNERHPTRHGPAQ